MSVRHTLRNIQRVRHITSILIKHGFDQVIEKLDLEYRVFAKKVINSSQEVLPQLSIAERARMVLEDLGPTFTKLGQILSTRPDLVPKSFIVEFQKLQDSAPPVKPEAIAEQIALGLGKTANEIFSNFDPQPLASASIGQVHKAQLRATNETVVVKVQRPGIRSVIESDIDLLYLLARLIEENIPETKMYSPVGIIEEFDKAIHSELDYTLEAQNMLRFQRNFVHDKTIYVPKVYRDLSTRNILITEYLHGTKILDIQGTPEHKRQIARIGFRSILKQIFIDGFFHGDPHPGNLFALDNDTLAFIDFGMMGRLDQEMKDDLADLLIAVINQDIGQIARILAQIGVQTREIDMRNFRRDIAEILDHYYGVPLQQIELGRVTREMVDVALKHQVRIPPDYTLMIKALLTIENIGKQLDPTLNAIEEAKPMVNAILKERWNPRRFVSESLLNVRSISQTMKDFPAQLHQVLEELRQGKLRIEFEHVHLERLIMMLDTASNRITAGLVLASLIIGSSIIMHTDRGPIFMEFPLLGIIGYVAAGIIGFWLLLSIFRSGRL
jgi:ubiquinone biosynthesis protein